MIEYPLCTEVLRDQGKPYPRTCAECGLGPCKRKLTAPNPNEPTLTCSEVVERLPISVRTFEFGFQWKQPHDAAYHIGLAAFSHAEILEFAEAYADAVLHSARDWGKIGYQQADDEYKKVCVLERRVQELEKALRKMATECHLCCCGGETHKNCPMNFSHSFLVCKLCKAESLSMTDPIPHKADCVLSDEWREQIRKAADHD